MSLAGRWLAITLLASCYGFANAASTGTIVETATWNDQPFPTDLTRIATLRLHLHDGDFRIVGSDSDEIMIHTDGKNRAQTRKMQVQLKRTGNCLDLTFLHVPKNEVQVTIVVPKETNLYARMRGGDLSVDGITGDKDLELTGGDLQIQVPDPAEYGPVDLSVRFGDVSGSRFGNPKGWLGNSLKRDGNGKYRLRAHVFAGDLTLKR